MFDRVQRYGREHQSVDRTSRALLENREEQIRKAQENIDVAEKVLEKIDGQDLKKISNLPKQQLIKVDGKKVPELGKTGPILKPKTIKALAATKDIPRAQPKTNIKGRGKRQDPLIVKSQKYMISKLAPSKKWYKIGTVLYFKENEKRIYKANVNRWFVLSKDGSKWLPTPRKSELKQKLKAAK